MSLAFRIPLSIVLVAQAVFLAVGTYHLLFSNSPAVWTLVPILYVVFVSLFADIARATGNPEDLGAPTTSNGNCISKLPCLQGFWTPKLSILYSSLLL